MRLFACVRSFHESADLFLTFSILAAGSKSFVDVARVFSTVIVPSPFARLNHFSRRGRQESVYAMAALACHSVSVRATAPASVRGARGVVKATRLPVSRAPRVVASRTRRGDAAVTCAAAELAQVALSEETITIIVAAVVGLGAGLGIPIFFVMQVRASAWLIRLSAALWIGPGGDRLSDTHTHATPCQLPFTTDHKPTHVSHTRRRNATRSVLRRFAN
jgi:hypothetical protein|tara:strand:- start:4601 stop:5257 length:657 start_codon:yes stop_codon:yes gene_type:complete